MSLFSYMRDGVAGIGAHHGGRWFDLGSGDLGDALRDGRLDALKQTIAASPALEPGSFQFLPLLPHPRKLICVGLNYKDHREEARLSEAPAYPDFFARFATTLVGHEGVILRPRCSTALDFEGELAVVIGRTAKHISAPQALDVVAGYSAFNDATIRDYQFRASQWTWGKNFDATGGFGPVLVTPDELPRSVDQGLKIETRLNGEIVQSASTADLIFDIPTLIAMLSEAMMLEPGDVIVTGTPGGVGFVRKPPIFMQPGDSVEVEIEGVGCLRNRVADETAG